MDTKQKVTMTINSDELAELIEGEPGIYAELLDDDPDGIMIEWEVGRGFNMVWLCWADDQTFIVDTFYSDSVLNTIDLGTGDRLTVDEILDIVL